MSFLKILKFVSPYKTILIIASLLSVLFSVSNGLTLYSVVPIMDSLTDADKPFSFSVKVDDKLLASKTNIGIIDKIKSLPVKAKEYLNSYFAGKTRKEILTTMSLAIIPLVALRAIFDIAAKFLFSVAGNKAVFDIRNRLFAHIIRLPYSYFHRSRSGELISRITMDVIPLTNALSTELYNLVSGVILLITNIVILTLVSGKMMIFILILMPLIGIPINLFGNIVKKYTRKIQESFANISSHLQETFSGIKVIKSFGMEDYENKRFGVINDIIFSRDNRKRVYQNLNPSIVELLGSIAAIALFIYGGYQIIHEEITSGEFIFFMLMVLNLFEPVKMISNAINGTKAAEAVANRIFQVLEYPAEDLTAGGEGSFDNVIKFENLSFKYSDDLVLKDINISIEKNKRTALVGMSGSGKSTILNMIASFYHPTHGRILIDKDDMSGLSPEWIRKKIAFVTQEVFLFHGTILENITCGKNAPLAKVIDAAKTAHAHEFIAKLPDGYSSIVGERGAKLSGGEKQRISIARAVLADPQIILFDEATSALDSESEKLIADSLEVLLKNRTAVIVSHRLSTIRNADVIYVIDKGEIIGKGSHNELIASCEGYKKLFDNQ